MALVFYLHISKLETSQKFKEKNQSRVFFFFTILTLASFWEEIRRGFSVSGGVDR